MDPVSHLLFARMVAALRPARELPRGVVAATVLGGIAPDVDAAIMAIGWDIYLRWHDAGTHAIAGTPVVALATGAFVRTWAPSTSLVSLTFAAWLGALSHVFFDLYSGASMRLLWPASDRVIAAPIAAMADPAALVVLLVGALALWVWPRVPRTAGALVMALLALLSAARLTTRAWAADAYVQAAEATGAGTDAVAIEADWGSGADWLVFDRTTDKRIRAWAVDGWTGAARLRFEILPAHDAPFASASFGDFATVRNFVPTHQFAFPTGRRNEDGSRVVFWSDARFCWHPSERYDSQEGVPHQDVRPATGPVRCALWFGGSYDVDQRPVEALVWLGGHLQRRRPGTWNLRLP